MTKRLDPAGQPWGRPAAGEPEPGLSAGCIIYPVVQDKLVRRGGGRLKAEVCPLLFPRRARADAGRRVRVPAVQPQLLYYDDITGRSSSGT